MSLEGHITPQRVVCKLFSLDYAWRCDRFKIELAWLGDNLLLINVELEVHGFRTQLYISSCY